MPNSTYPRTTVAAIVAGLAGGIASAVITAATITTLTVTTLFGTTINGTAANIATVNATTTQATTANATTASSTNLVIGQGTTLTKHLEGTATIDADSISNGSNTSSQVTVTGAAVGNFVSVGFQGDWTGASSSVRVIPSVTAANTVTLVFQNNSSTAVNLSRTALLLDVWAH